jgi:RNA polymerase sigma factor (sigma-70 family)
VTAIRPAPRAGPHPRPRPTWSGPGTSATSSGTSDRTRSGGPRDGRRVVRASPPPDEADLAAVLPAVRRVAAAGDPDLVEDVVQETAARLWAVRWRVERRALQAYGVAVARNLLVSAERERVVRDRHAARLAEPPAVDDHTVDDPAAGVLRAEEHAALRAALGLLRPDDRDLIVEHELRGVPVAELARRRDTNPGAVAARLARARARLRVRHLLAYGRVRPPTPCCEPVLDAISLNDRSRQRTLDAPGHLAACPSCSDLAVPLRRVRGSGPGRSRRSG